MLSDSIKLQVLRFWLNDKYSEQDKVYLYNYLSKSPFRDRVRAQNQGQASGVRPALAQARGAFGVHSGAKPSHLSGVSRSGDYSPA